MANIVLVPKRKMITANTSPGITDLVNNVANTYSSVTNYYNTTIGGGTSGKYLPLAGGTMLGPLNSPILLKIPVGNNVFG